MDSRARQVFESIKKFIVRDMKLGDNIVKYQMAVLVCLRCTVPLEVTNTRLGSYKCPECGRFRNAKQRFYMSYRDFIEFRKVGTNESEVG